MTSNDNKKSKMLKIQFFKMWGVCLKMPETWQTGFRRKLVPNWSGFDVVYALFCHFQFFGDFFALQAQKLPKITIFAGPMVGFWPPEGQKMTENTQKCVKTTHWTQANTQIMYNCDISIFSEKSLFWPLMTH